MIISLMTMMMKYLLLVSGSIRRLQGSIYANDNKKNVNDENHVMCVCVQEVPEDQR